MRSGLRSLSSAADSDNDDISGDYVLVDNKTVSVSVSSSTPAVSEADKSAVDKLLKFVADNDVQMVSVSDALSISQLTSACLRSYFFDLL